MEKEDIPERMEGTTKESIRMIRSTDMVFIAGKTAGNTEEDERMGNSTVKGNMQC